MFAQLKSFLAPPVFADEELTRKAKTLNAVLIVAILNGVLGLIALITGVVGVEANIGPLLAGFMAFLVILVLVMHRGYVEAAGSLFVFGALLIVSATVWQGNGLKDSTMMAYFVIMLLASLLSSRWITILMAGLAIVFGWVFVYGESIGLITANYPPSFSLMLQYSFIFPVGGVLAYLVVDGLQKAVARVQESNQELQQLSQQLEQRVQERTRELAVAAEVGRRISRVQDLDKLLVESVELIQQRFNLYHAQIYLADAAGQTLNLRASTASVGRQLLSRGHKLPIRKGSINGTAAFDKEPVLVADTSTNPMFRPNPLLPFTRSEMAVPLLVGEQLLGVLDLQSDQAGAFSSDNLSIYRSLADQLAVAVNNAYLLRQAEQTRQQVERYEKLVTRKDQAEVVADTEQKERIGVRYDLNDLEEYDGLVTAESGNQVLRVPITVADANIGTILLETKEEQAWTEETRSLVTAVAQQVGRQAENLRLLSEADRYRTEAEVAARRLSREVWREFLQEQLGGTNGFIYKENEVASLAEEDAADDIADDAVRQRLKVHNEAVGELVVSGADQDEAQALLAAVTHQLSRHIENIRLAEQTALALEQTESLYQIGHELNVAANVDEILLAALGPIFPTGIDEASLMFIELNRQGKPQTLELLAGWRQDGTLSFPVGTIFPMQQFPFTNLFIDYPDVPQLIGDASTDPRVDNFTRGVMAHAGIKAIAVIPLTVAGQWVGIITCSWPETHTFSKQEEEIFKALINMAAPAVQSQRLHFKTKVQADKERLINEINQQILNTDSMESALETAVKELGQALQTTTQVRLSTDAEKKQNNYKEAEAVSAD